MSLTLRCSGKSLRDMDLSLSAFSHHSQKKGYCIKVMQYPDISLNYQSQKMLIS